MVGEEGREGQGGGHGGGHNGQEGPQREGVLAVKVTCGSIMIEGLSGLRGSFGGVGGLEGSFRH